METVLITGGTGLIGTALSKFLLSRGYQVIILTRNPKTKKKMTTPGISYASWDIEKEIISEEVFKNANYIIHLAGAGVADKPWTEKRKTEIVESRVKSSALLVKALETIPNHII